MTDKRKKERRCNIIITRVEMDHRRETAHRTEQRGKEEEQTNRNRSMSGKEEESTFFASVEENERPAVEEAKNRLPSLSAPSFHPSSFFYAVQKVRAKRCCSRHPPSPLPPPPFTQTMPPPQPQPTSRAYSNSAWLKSIPGPEVGAVRLKDEGGNALSRNVSVEFFRCNYPPP